MGIGSTTMSLDDSCDPGDVCIVGILGNAQDWAPRRPGVVMSLELDGPSPESPETGVVYESLASAPMGTAQLRPWTDVEKGTLVKVVVAARRLVESSKDRIGSPPPTIGVAYVFVLRLHKRRGEQPASASTIPPPFLARFMPVPNLAGMQCVPASANRDMCSPGCRYRRLICGTWAKPRCACRGRVSS